MNVMVILGLFEGIIFTDVNAFLVLMIFLGAFIGAMSKSLIIAVYSGFLIFIYIVINTDLAFFDNIGIAIMVIFILFLSFRIVSYAMGNENQV